MRQTSLYVFIAFCAFASQAPGQEEKRITRHDVPPAVLSAFTKAYPKAAVKGFSAERDSGTTSYEVESVEGKTHRDVQYAADGTVLAVEESMELSALPERVRASAAKEYPNGTILSAEKITEKGATGYELIVKHGRTKTELRFDAEGKITERE